MLLLLFYSFGIGLAFLLLMSAQIQVIKTGYLTDVFLSSSMYTFNNGTRL